MLNVSEKYRLTVLSLFYNRFAKIGKSKLKVNSQFQSVGMYKSRNFQPGQILFLENGDTRLYGELIQIIPDRGLFWVRPLFLVDSQAEIVSNLCNVSDLLWCGDLFEAALDTEVINFFTQASTSEDKLESELINKKSFQDFVQSFWQSSQA
ncbi:hypothetical protein [Calothrix sp. PCC 6303]|uniref:hypothetical protein n=1 Tax=Calothrix sp. PCC 6303 TaxID=1170562 RepID=UPI0002A04B26|nr:hypothetical protein [Calothrix sp. PCC 6303]AFZ03932.1 hypothetical protein Cal6303_5043 [Calothrix sp. PCC 6303]